MLKDYGTTNFITGLRAIAASMVVIIHTGALNGFGLVGQNMTSAGLGGVYIFFVIAGFSVTQSFLSEKNYKLYILKRLLRIAPPYYLVLTISFLLIVYGHIDAPDWANQYNTSFDLRNYVSHLFFLNFLDKSLANTVIGVEWTLSIEVFWYLIIPAFLIIGRSWWFLAAWFVLVYITSTITKPLVQDSEFMEAFWLPTRYGFYFLLGVIAHKYRTDFLEKLDKWNIYLLGIGILLYVINVALSIGNTPRVLAVATFLIMCGYNGQWAGLKTAFESKVILFLGSISYALYLVHFPIISVLKNHGIITTGLLGFVIVFGISIIISSLITIGVDSPVRRLSKMLTDKNSSKFTKTID